MNVCRTSSRQTAGDPRRAPGPSGYSRDFPSRRSRFERVEPAVERRQVEPAVTDPGRELEQAVAVERPGPPKRWTKLHPVRASQPASVVAERRPLEGVRPVRRKARQCRPQQQMEPPRRDVGRDELDRRGSANVGTALPEARSTAAAARSAAARAGERDQEACVASDRDRRRARALPAPAGSGRELPRRRATPRRGAPRGSRGSRETVRLQRLSAPS